MKLLAMACVVVALVVPAGAQPGPPAPNCVLTGVTQQVVFDCGAKGTSVGGYHPSGEEVFGCCVCAQWCDPTPGVPLLCCSCSSWCEGPGHTGGSLCDPGGPCSRRGTDVTRRWWCPNGSGGGAWYRETACATDTNPDCQCVGEEGCKE